ncbi:hypothetical protein [Dactylosporangium sp. NPDC051484]|uniref:hypothetical protein n=1 Tax=Dactylosporangium sp. NPDC051484 TaxID=3154942 RepID=UPI00344EC623
MYHGENTEPADAPAAPGSDEPTVPAGPSPAAPSAAPVPPPGVIAAYQSPTAPAAMIAQQRGPEMYAPRPSNPAPPPSAAPYSAQPYSALPFSTPPASAPPYSAPPFSAPPGSTQAFPAPPGPGQPAGGPGYWPVPPAGPVPQVPPRPRRGGLVATGVVAAVVLVLSLAVWIASAGPAGQHTFTGPGHALPGRSGAAAGTVPGAKGEGTVSDKILATLSKQSTALLAGDRDGYLTGVGGGLRDGFTRRFGSLRAMGVQTWKPTLVDKPAQTTDGTWSVLVRYDYCFGKGCTQLFPQVVQTSWTVTGDQASIAKYEKSSEPWDASALQALTGRRVIVAGAAANAGKLQRVLAKADAAADVADRYARWDPPPKWYIVYVAGESEWKTWWDNGDIAASYDGYSTGPRGIVMQAADSTQQWLQILLAHEFGHVVTVGEDYGTADDWWLVEGIADYISDRDGTAMRGRLPGVRRFVKKGWNGSITLGPPPTTASGEEIDARYGIALIAVTCLSKKFGEPKMLDFFGEVVRKNMPLASASTSVLGSEWTGVASACATQVRNS